ncbi:MAG: FAD-binding oxidoreductase [Candidatus Obscuribacterales bacterium]|nr:FAD-binding oxidoreductase [Candidatus Obscuribacterales bacterium]
MNTKNVLIIGAGVSGLTTALHLIKAGFNVTVWSKEAAGTFPVTSASAYAMWVPVKIDADPRIEQWTFESLNAFRKLAEDPSTGVRLLDIFQLKTERSEPWFASSFAEFRHSLPEEISPDYADAHVLQSAPVIDPEVYLPWLQQQVLAAGGKFEQQTVTDLSALPSQYGIIVNCTGLGARTLVPDADVFADRVQVVKIKNKGVVNKVIIDDEGPNKRACIVPHGSYVKLGGVFDGDQDGTEIDDTATQDILDRCNRLVPELNATTDDIVAVTRACRPERKGWLPRVEAEPLLDGRTVIHNYGHDGMGYLLSIGIASHIAAYAATLEGDSE